MQPDGRDEGYWRRLVEAYNPATLERLMCREQIHVSWNGTLHDCDFNYALGMPTDAAAPRHIRDFDVEQLRRRRIRTARHCLGCTAGSGSSCGGADRFSTQPSLDGRGCSVNSDLHPPRVRRKPHENSEGCRNCETLHYHQCWRGRPSCS
ncbi:MAG: DUF3641 domain-containing protein [Planctomycetes bacterium]|nr:DUF3641 domain-containing protein [Planctomycetota bacterium]